MTRTHRLTKAEQRIVGWLGGLWANYCRDCDDLIDLHRRGINHEDEPLRGRRKTAIDIQQMILEGKHLQHKETQ
jgi:hypothetical protein